MKFHLSNPFDPPSAPPAFGRGKTLPEKSSPLVFNSLYFHTCQNRFLSLGFFQGLSSIGFHLFLRLGSPDHSNQPVCPNPNPNLLSIFIDHFCRPLGTSTVSVNHHHYRQSWKEFLFTMSTRNASTIHEFRFGNAEYRITDIIRFTK